MKNYNKFVVTTFVVCTAIGITLALIAYALSDSWELSLIIVVFGIYFGITEAVSGRKFRPWLTEEDSE